MLGFHSQGGFGRFSKCVFWRVREILRWPMSSQLFLLLHRWWSPKSFEKCNTIWVNRDRSPRNAPLRTYKHLPIFAVEQSKSWEIHIREYTFQSSKLSQLDHVSQFSRKPRFWGQRVPWVRKQTTTAQPGWLGVYSLKRNTNYQVVCDPQWHRRVTLLFRNKFVPFLPSFVETELKTVSFAKN